MRLERNYVSEADFHIPFGKVFPAIWRVCLNSMYGFFLSWRTAFRERTSTLLQFAGAFDRSYCGGRWCSMRLPERVRPSINIILLLSAHTHTGRHRQPPPGQCKRCRSQQYSSFSARVAKRLCSDLSIFIYCSIRNYAFLEGPNGSLRVSKATSINDGVSPKCETKENIYNFYNLFEGFVFVNHTASNHRSKSQKWDIFPHSHYSSDLASSMGTEPFFDSVSMPLAWWMGKMCS